MLAMLRISDNVEKFSWNTSPGWLIGLFFISVLRGEGTKNTLNIDEIRVDDAFDLYALCNCLVELLNKF